jgi:hypothetical protein
MLAVFVAFETDVRREREAEGIANTGRTPGCSCSRPLYRLTNVPRESRGDGSYDIGARLARAEIR